MKTILLLLCLGSSSAFADVWTTADTYRESVYLALHTIDWSQTRSIARNPDKWYEQNNIIGTHPSLGTINKYFITTTVLQFSIAYVLPGEWRRPFQYVTIVNDAGYAVHNFRLGIRAKF